MGYHRILHGLLDDELVILVIRVDHRRESYRRRWHAKGIRDDTTIPGQEARRLQVPTTCVVGLTPDDVPHGELDPGLPL